MGTAPLKVSKKVNVRSFRNLLSSLTARYALALFTIGLLVVSVPFLVRDSIHQQTVYHQTIVLAFDIRDLSEELTQNVIHHQLLRSFEPDSKIEGSVEKEIHEFKEIFFQFYQSSLKLELSQDEKAEFVVHMRNMYNKVKNFIEDVDRLFEISHQSLRNRTHFIQKFINEERELREAIRFCVSDLEEALSGQVTKFNQIQWAMTFVLLFVLILQGVLVLRPAVKKVGMTLVDLRTSESQLLEAREKAIEALKIRSDFITNISHEIRNPLNAIIGMGDLLTETHLDMSQKRYVEIFRRAGQSILDLINDFLDFSRLEAGRFVIEKIKFDLMDTIDRAMDIISSRAEDKGLELILDFDWNLPTEVMGDPKRIQQILINFLGNSVKFTSRGEVVLTVSRENKGTNRDTLVLSVSDTGIGIPKDRQTRIFDSFVQVDSSIPRKFGGNGLGLAICKELSQMMGGSISLESEEGKGSTFTVRLPFYPANSLSLLSRFKDIHLKGVKIALSDANEKRAYSIAGFLSALGGEIELVDCFRLKNEWTRFDMIIADLSWIEEIESFYHVGKPKKKIVWFTSLRDLKSVSKRVSKVSKIAFCIPKPIKLSQLGDFLRDIHHRVIHEDFYPLVSTVRNELIPAKILIVEDSEDNRMVFEAYLKSTPFQVSFALNGIDGVDQFILGNFDLVFMDIQMPEMDGFTAIRTIRQFEIEKNLRPVPIVALTAYGHQEEIQKCFASGCSRHLTKPVKKMQLIQMIEEIIQLKSQKRDLFVGRAGQNEADPKTDMPLGLLP